MFHFTKIWPVTDTWKCGGHLLEKVLKLKKTKQKTFGLREPQTAPKLPTSGFTPRKRNELTFEEKSILREFLFTYC